MLRRHLLALTSGYLLLPLQASAATCNDLFNVGRALDAICQEFDFANSIIGVLRLPAGPAPLQASVGVESRWLARIQDYGPEIVAAWGGAERIQQVPLDEPIITTQVIGRTALQANRYFREWAQPQGIFDAIAIALARDPTMIGNISFGRHEQAGEIGEREVEGLRLLAPHIRRAVTISNLFDMKAIEAASFASALDGLSFGLVLVDERLGIVHANAAAGRMLSERDPILSEKGMLLMHEPESQTALARAVHQGTTNESTLGPRGIGIAARRREGGPCVIHVLPLRHSEMRGGLAPRAAAALFVAPATAPPRMPSGALALLYDLTPAETRIFEMLTDGLTQANIAAALGIAASTVKTHVLHLFEKTGCQRQADLLRLSASLSSPI
jgi:DNA-binding CsgD family transcriptional regulator